MRSVALGSRHRQPRGMEQKLEAQFFGMPGHQTSRAASVSALAVWTVAACLLGRCGRAGASFRPASKQASKITGSSFVINGAVNDERTPGYFACLLACWPKASPRPSTASQQAGSDRPHGQGRYGSCPGSLMAGHSEKLSFQFLFHAPGLSMARAQSDASHTPPAQQRNVYPR